MLMRMGSICLSLIEKGLIKMNQRISPYRRKPEELRKEYKAKVVGLALGVVILGAVGYLDQKEEETEAKAGLAMFVSQGKTPERGYLYSEEFMGESEAYDKFGFNKKKVKQVLAGMGADQKPSDVIPRLGNMQIYDAEKRRFRGLTPEEEKDFLERQTGVDLGRGNRSDCKE